MRGIKRSRWIEAACLLLFPVGMLIGMWLSAKWMALFTILLLIVSVLLFFGRFERRAGQPRDILPVVVLSAVAVAGRYLFSPFPDIKPVSAIVILSGICFGPMSGFMTGALSALCSNMFFGQGDFTPWQMYAWGLCGYLAGVLAERGRLKNMWQVLLYGFLAALLYGAIMDAQYVIGWIPRPLTGAAVLAAYAAGLPHSLMHGAATVGFLWLLYRPWSVKLRRIKQKFGIGDAAE